MNEENWGQKNGLKIKFKIMDPLVMWEFVLMHIFGDCLYNFVKHWFDPNNWEAENYMALILKLCISSDMDRLVSRKWPVEWRGILAVDTVARYRRSMIVTQTIIRQKRLLNKIS